MAFSVFSIVPVTASAAEYTTKGYKYSVNNSNATITGYSGNETILNIPSKLGGYNVTSIGINAFKQNSKITGITLPNSVTKISSNSFSDCTKLTTVAIGNSVDSMGSYAFAGCILLNKVTIANGSTIIGYGAFQDCTSLITVSIPNTVTKIDGYAFNGCTSLSRVAIPNSVRSIGNNAFYNCKNMSSVTLGNSLTSIGDSAFKNCSNMTSITIPNSVTKIGSNSFSDCTKLTTVAIGNSVDSMGSYAFAGCILLNKVTIANGSTIIGYGAFRNCTSLKMVSIPDPFIQIGNARLNNDDLTDKYVFYNCPSTLTIYGKSGSFAHQFANANGIKFSTSTITIPTEPTSVSINPSKLSLTIGETYTLTKSVYPKNASTSYRWSSSNTRVAAVDSAGKVTAKAAGQAIVTVKTANGKTAACSVTVKSSAVNATGITLNRTSCSLNVGGSVLLSATVKPSNTTDKTVTWKSSNTSVATVSNGMVTAKKVGTSTIAARTSNGKTATCVVTVVSSRTPQIVVDTKTAGPGGTVTVNVSMKNNPGINGWAVSVGYDSNALELKSCEQGDFGEITTSNIITKNPYHVQWFDLTNVKTNGNLFTLTFVIKSNAKEGTYPITVTYDKEEICNDKEENVHFDVMNGAVKVAAHTPGDINEDGKVNLRDVIRLNQFVAGWNVKVNEGAKDVNGDGKVNLRDVIRLNQYVAGWDVNIY
nr:leucine-rich repeat protein [Ruminococcus sp. zg-924]